MIVRNLLTEALSLTPCSSRILSAPLFGPRSEQASMPISFNANMTKSSFSILSSARCQVLAGLRTVNEPSCSLRSSARTDRGRLYRSSRQHFVLASANRQSANQHLERYFSRPCSSCDFSRQYLQFNRLPGSHKQGKHGEVASEQERILEGEEANSPDRVQAHAPRVTLFKDPGSKEFAHDRAPIDSTTRAGVNQTQDPKVKSTLRDIDHVTLNASKQLGESVNNQIDSQRRLSREASRVPSQSTEGDGILGPQADSRLAKPNRSLNETSKRLLTTSEDYERVLWRAARNYQQQDHYDYSLFGLNVDLDKAVARHQRETMLYNQDRHLKDEQAKQVAPNLKQSPIAIMSVNPAYELQNKPLVIEYPATVENLRLNNTGFSWEVKIPYQISMTTALYGAHLNQSHRYRLDQFHCHWGDSPEQGGSEHTVDNHSYSAELHFVHYNMEKYHKLSKAARHPDGLLVLSVFIDAHPDHHNHAELDKIVAHMKSIQLKGEHAIIRHAVRIENLLPANKSYWSYQGSLTTPPYLESVTWFVLKYPIRCNSSQIEKFRSLSSSVRRDDDQVFIKSNHRRTQPLNGRTVVMYDEPINAGSQQMAARNF